MNTDIEKQREKIKEEFRFYLLRIAISSRVTRIPSRRKRTKVRLLASALPSILTAIMLHSWNAISLI